MDASTLRLIMELADLLGKAPCIPVAHSALYSGRGHIGKIEKYKGQHSGTCASRLAWCSVNTCAATGGQWRRRSS